jgi:hypothetical protein
MTTKRRIVAGLLSSNVSFMNFLTFNTVMVNILQAILFVCRRFYPYGDEPDNGQSVVMPLYTWIFRLFKEKPGIWRLGKNNLDRLRLCFIPGFTACNHPIFCSSERTYHPLCLVCF